ncbi:hypothetical protein [Micromonospora ureilytica]|nr:hypothetical protein [Micromonospora ureilytica]WSG34295.1 hypothetical protein OHB55_09995 [Micromonospora ureilytica]
MPTHEADAHRKRPTLWVRIGSAVLAVQMLALGVPASVAPLWFFDWFPFGAGWVAAGGPYNGHLLSDLGYAYLALAVVLGWAAVRPVRELCLAAAAAAVVANTPHLLFHLAHAEALPIVDSVAENALLAFTVVVGLAVFFGAYRIPAGGVASPAQQGVGLPRERA